MLRTSTRTIGDHHRILDLISQLAVLLDAVVMDPESLPDPNIYAHDLSALRPVFETLAAREDEGNP